MKENRRQTFDVTKALPTAWAILWREKLAHQKKGGWGSENLYLTATDIAEQVRAFAQDQADGKPWRTIAARGGLYVVRVSTGRPGGLLQAARSWLLGEARRGRLEMFNHGRGHVSGARFRPAGVGLTVAEKATMAANAKPRSAAPFHYNERGFGRPFCTAATRSRFSFRSRAFTRATNVEADITCARCRNLVAAGKAPAPAVFDAEREA